MPHTAPPARCHPARVGGEWGEGRAHDSAAPAPREGRQSPGFVEEGHPERLDIGVAVRLRDDDGLSASPQLGHAPHQHHLQQACTECLPTHPAPPTDESVMPSNHLILCCPLLLSPSIFPSIRVFSNESALRARGTGVPRPLSVSLLGSVKTNLCTKAPTLLPSRATGSLQTKHLQPHLWVARTFQGGFLATRQNSDGRFI